MKFSIIIPVYNEEGMINDTIAEIKRLGDSEIIVSDANGNTNKHITDEHVIKIISSKGRGIQMNTGANCATGDVFVFLHADTKLPENYQEEIENSLKTHNVGAFMLKIHNSKFIYRLIEKGVSFRNKITKIPYGDQAVFCSRQAFQTIGGFMDIPIMEDVRFMQDCKKHKMKVYLSNVPVLTSARRWENEGFLYTLIRNSIIILLYYIGFSPKLLKKFYK